MGRELVAKLRVTMQLEIITIRDSTSVPYPQYKCSNYMTFTQDLPSSQRIGSVVAHRILWMLMDSQSQCLGFVKQNSTYLNPRLLSSLQLYYLVVRLTYTTRSVYTSFCMRTGVYYGRVVPRDAINITTQNRWFVFLEPTPSLSSSSLPDYRPRWPKDILWTILSKRCHITSQHPVIISANAVPQYL